MTPLEKIQSMKMPFAELKGVTFTEAGMDRVVAKMLVRPDLCTLRNTIHGGAMMAFADSVGAAATVINLPADAKGTTTIESKTNFIGGAKEGLYADRHRNPGASGTPHPGLADAAGDRGRQAGGRRDPDPDGAVASGRLHRLHGVQHPGLRMTIHIFEKLLVGAGDGDLVVEPQFCGRPQGRQIFHRGAENPDMGRDAIQPSVRAPTGFSTSSCRRTFRLPPPSRPTTVM